MLILSTNDLFLDIRGGIAYFVAHLPYQFSQSGDRPSKAEHFHFHFSAFTKFLRETEGVNVVEMLKHPFKSIISSRFTKTDYQRSLHSESFSHPSSFLSRPK